MVSPLFLAQGFPACPASHMHQNGPTAKTQGGRGGWGKGAPPWGAVGRAQTTGVGGWTVACPKAHQLGTALCHLPMGQCSPGRAVLLPLKLLGSSLSLGCAPPARHASATGLCLAWQLKGQVGQEVGASNPGSTGGQCPWSPTFSQPMTSGQVSWLPSSTLRAGASLPLSPGPALRTEAQ